MQNWERTGGTRGLVPTVERSGATNYRSLDRIGRLEAPPEISRLATAREKSLWTEPDSCEVFVTNG